LESVKKELEDKVIVIAKQLEEGDESRKRLIEQTKDFKKSLNEDQRKLVGPIMKSFQGEVDSSYKRSKLMEQVLLKLYKKLIELPDPTAALESSQRQQKKLDRIYELEIENKQLKEKLDEYESEFNQVKNQEVTIKSLKEKIKEHEERLEQTLQQKLKEREKELERAYAIKDEQLQASQLDLSKKSTEIEARCAHLQAQLHKAHTDLYDFKSKQDELMNAKSCEIDLLMQDLDKLTDRAVNAERLAEQYAKQLSIKSHESNEKLLSEQLNAAEVNFSNDQKAAYEVELAAKEKEIAQLLDDINKLHIKSNKAKEFYENQRKQIEEKLVSRERTLEQLEYDLKLRHDYDEIKRELNTLKLIEFSSSTVENSQSVFILILLFS
jgi:homeobox protein cut-like